MFENSSFIKSPTPFTREFDREKSPCFIFRKRFYIEKPVQAKLSVCGLGYAYYYLNGQRISNDLFTAPVSNYNKTLWVNTYDVTEFLCDGENVLSVICGNGFFNESFKTSWDLQDASYRDNPKFILSLENHSQEIVVSDSSWKCNSYAPIVYNHLRSGEHFDSRYYDPDFCTLGYNDDDWEFAVVDNNAPKGVFRECKCQPIRECAIYRTVDIIKTGQNKYIFDIGQNISGYIRLKVKQECGDLLVIRYAETLNQDNSLDMDGATVHYFGGSEYMTDKFICNGEEFVWSPMFTYHGFRYIEIDGIKNPTYDSVAGIFVHQDIDIVSDFRCSDSIMNKLYRMGQMSTLSNLFYMPTDCPTREKFGWMNDAQASIEQMLINFDVADLLKKWNTDITDAMAEDGSLPGIVPTPGWGYEWGNGPVSDGCMFELPYKVYLYTNDKSLLINNLRYFERYIDYLMSRREDDGMVNFGLDDWASPEKTKVPSCFINTVLFIKFLKIAALAATFSNEEALAEKFSLECKETEKLFKDNFINSDGTCTINEQTAVALIIYYDLFENIQPLKLQLKKLIEDSHFHHNCGMVGLRRLYIALNKCELPEYAYKIITAKGYPSYTEWIDAGATTLFELWWQVNSSKNHHMYSDFMSWIMKTLVGINICPDDPAYHKVLIKPVFISNLDFCEGYTQTPNGKIRVSWSRDNEKIILEVTIPENTIAVCEYSNAGILKSGHNVMEIHL